MRISRALLLLLVTHGPLAGATAQAPAAQMSNRVSLLGWLSGCWEQRTPRGVTTEMWSMALGGMMIGGSISVRDGVARGFEHVRIEEHGGRLVYIALPSGQQETAFTETALSDSSVVFENPDHDFPQRLSYRRVGADSLVARAEGPGPQGPRGFDVRMARAACPGS